MNRFDWLLSRTPVSDTSWHCPWFRVIEGLAANGAFFGMFAYWYYDTGLGLLAGALGISSGAFCLGSRTRHDATC
jgi:hypothetical protein